jgi:tetratricopeptide (TPR) repeat protein
MNPQFLLSRAFLLHQNGKLEEAANLYQQVLASGERNFRARYLFAVLRYQQQRTAEALAEVNAALAIEPAAAEALVLQGTLLLQNRQPQRAVASLERAVAVRPDYADAWTNLGVVLAGMDQHAGALAAFDKVLALVPRPEIWNARGLTLRALNRNEDALASFDRALALKPSFAGALINRGALFNDEKRFADALVNFDQMVVLEPGNVVAHYNRGLALQGLGRVEEALASYRQALTIQPGFAAAHYNSGVLLHNRRDRLAEALACFDKALALTPDNAKAWASRAATLQAMQRFDEALVSADRALALDPAHAPAYAARGSILCEMNHVADGMTNFARHAELTHARVAAEIWRPPHKQRHDQEQRDHLAARGVMLKPGTLHRGEGARLAAPAINAANVDHATHVWKTSRPQIVVIDNLLTEAALIRLRDFCLDSTVWQQVHPEGYLGAQPENGFASPLLAQIADELRDTFPAIFGVHPLRHTWAYKYDSSLKGIDIHADFAAVNVNFWITPDEANLNPASGGLVVWDIGAPLEWDFADYNGNQGIVRDFLTREGAKPVTIPYRANRAVIFDSALFHKTDDIAFAEGYLNRRINVTMLYGRRRWDGG